MNTLIPENCCEEGTLVIEDFLQESDRQADRSDNDALENFLAMGYFAKRVKIVRNCPGKMACALRATGCLSQEPSMLDKGLLDAEVLLVIKNILDSDK